MEVSRMRKFSKTQTTAAIILAISSSQAYSQSDEEPGLFASAEAVLAHDDNIYRVTDDLAISDTYIRLTPEVSAVGGLGKHRFQLNYSGDYAKFSDQGEADYADHDITARVDLAHTLRLSTRFEAGYIKDHEEPGSINRIQLDISEYNKFDQSYYLAAVAYGSERAIGRLELRYRRTEKEYTTNSLDFLNNTNDQFSALFVYRIAPKTKVYIEGISTTFDYKLIGSYELDNTYNRYRAGITWDFTNKLSGDINIGYQERDYDLERLRDISGLAYNGEIIWALNTYTILAIEARRESVDSSLEETGGFLRTTYGASLTHELTERTKIVANVGAGRDELVFTSSREDRRLAYKLSIEYELLRNLSIGTFISFEERDSTDPLADFEANIVGLNMTVDLGN